MYVYMHPASVGVSGNWTSSVRLFLGLSRHDVGGAGAWTQNAYGVQFISKKKKNAGKTKEKTLNKFNMIKKN